LSGKWRDAVKKSLTKKTSGGLAEVKSRCQPLPLGLAWSTCFQDDLSGTGQARLRNKRLEAGKRE